MTDLIKNGRISALEDSLIALEYQAKKLQQAIAEGTKRWAGMTPKESLRDTAKAIILDAGTLQDMCGADEWSEAKKQFGYSILREIN